MRVFRFLLLAAVSLGLFIVLNRSWPVQGARVPPPGRFLNPYAGFWTNGDGGGGGDTSPETVSLPDLLSPVTVRWDDRRVPHIFAENDHDAFFMQGYLTARDRLWQMEFQTLAAAGRLSEVAGEPLLELDRYHRRLGLAEAADRAMEAIGRDPATLEALEAYTDGVNAWIDRLTPATLPLEYKILDYEPEPWTPLKTPLLLKSMSLTLTGRNHEKAMTLTREIFGRETTDRLFPAHRPGTMPIIPSNRLTPFGGKAGDRTPSDHPPDLDGWAFIDPAAGNDDLAAPSDSPEPPSLGSNNWAVAGSKTASGSPILCSDPHLPLTLPSIWYELQITTPAYSAYGVSMPGAPGILIGFNRHIAWGETNAETDVLDQYLLHFQDDGFDEYFHDGRWKKVAWKEERYNVRGRAPVVEKVAWTELGPVPYLPGERPFLAHLVPGAALRWTAHDPSNEARTFLALNKAKDYDSFQEALRHFDTPAQNFVFASVDGDIAIHHAGKLPVRSWGQGVYLSDGADPSARWRGFIPREELPHILNPAQQFVGSANQNPVDDTYPYFLGIEYAPYFRSSRIYHRLQAMEGISPADMIDLQNDTVGLYARSLLPLLLEAIQGRERTEAEQSALREVESWDGSYDAGGIGPTVFHFWQRTLLNRIWSDDIQEGEKTGRRPRRDTTVELIRTDPNSRWFDDRTTPDVVETFQDLADASFSAAVRRLVELYGPPGDRWRWGNARGTDLRHIARIPGLGRMRLPTSGQAGVIRVATSSAGQSWRMVVSLEDPVRAWGIYPGGQSGNPGSRHYDDFVDRWVQGKLVPLLFLASPDAQDPRLQEQVIFEGTP